MNKRRRDFDIAKGKPIDSQARGLFSRPKKRGVELTPGQEFCKTCGKIFDSHKALLEHLRSSHPSHFSRQLVLPDVKSLRCRLCKMVVVNTASSREGHLRDYHPKVFIKSRSSFPPNVFTLPNAPKGKSRQTKR